MAPRLISWAVVTIRLCAAWRNTSVNRTTGTAAEAMMSASTWPGPTESSWSTSPTFSNAAPSGTAASRARISMTSTIDVSSITSRPQLSGLSASRLNPLVLGSNLEQAVDRLRLEPGGLAHPLRGAPGCPSRHRTASAPAAAGCRPCR